MLPFNLSQGQPLTVTLKSTLYWNVKKKVFKPATVENVFFDFFPLVQIKNSIVHFGKKKKNIKQILISNFLLSIVLLCIQKVLQILKNIHF